MGNRMERLGAPPASPSPPPRFRAALPDRVAYAALALLVLLASGLRVHRLSELPPGLFPDEAANGLDAIASLQTGNFQSFYPNNGGREGLIIALQALALSVFGATAATLRLPGVLAGTLAIAAVFLVARKAARLFAPAESSRRGIDGNALGVLAALFVATSHWHLSFSRTAFRGILDPLFGALALFALMAALERRSASRFAVAGVVTGLGLYGYSAYRFLVVPILVVLVLDAARRAGSLRAGIIRSLRDRGYWLYAVVTMLVAAPLLHFAITEPGQFFQRARAVSVMVTRRPWYQFWLSSKAAALQFFSSGDIRWRHNLPGEPALPLILSICFAAGLALAVVALASALHDRLPGRAGALYGRLRAGIRGWLSPALAFLLLAWLVAMLMPSALTYDGRPHFLRSIGAIPPAYALAAVGALGLLQLLAAALPSRLRAAGCVVAVLTLAASLVHRVHVSYFIEWGASRGVRVAFHAYAVEHAARIEALPHEVEKYVVCRCRTGGRADVHGCWELQPILFYTRTETGEARRAMNIRYLRHRDLPRVPYAETERHFFLTRYPRYPRRVAERPILETSPNAVIH
jgi:4-amino-4-deoxy-L-arabinose transferase-like glycosyltransferase